MNSTPPKQMASRSLMMGLLIALLVLGLPLAVWLDLTSLSEARLRRQAIDLMPTKYELVINFATALGLALPHSLLSRADELIE